MELKDKKDQLNYMAYKYSETKKRISKYTIEDFENGFNVCDSIPFAEKVKALQEHASEKAKDIKLGMEYSGGYGRQGNEKCNDRIGKWRECVKLLKEVEEAYNEIDKLIK